MKHLDIFHSQLLTNNICLVACYEDDLIVAGLWPIVSSVMFAVSIWGSVVVFGKLNEYLTLLENENSDLLKLSS